MHSSGCNSDLCRLSAQRFPLVMNTCSQLPKLSILTKFFGHRLQYRSFSAFICMNTKVRRISQACDICSDRRVRCRQSLEQPQRCQNCVDYGEQCTYKRPQRKRGAKERPRNHALPSWLDKPNKKRLIDMACGWQAVAGNVLQIPE